MLKSTSEFSASLLIPLTNRSEAATIKARPFARKRNMRKGHQTKQSILDEALKQAGRTGLSGLSIGGLAKDVGMSKSGLFGHFGSKEGLQIAILEQGSSCFINEIVHPAIRMPRGIPRLRGLFQNWLDWSESKEREGGCVFVSSTSEFDDRPGPVREVLANLIADWIETLRKAAELCVAEGHFRQDVDPEQFAYAMHAYMLEYNVRARLFRDSRARSQATLAFENLVQASRTLT